MSAPEAPAADDQLWAALQQWTQDPNAAANALQPLADQGDASAALLTAYLLAQTGRAPEGLPYARRAVDDGAPFIAANYVGNLINTEQKADALEMLERSVRAGWPMDPLGFMQQAAQTGDRETALKLLSLARQWPQTPTRTSDQLDQVLARVQSAEPEIQEAVGSTKAAGEQAKAAIRAAESELATERDRARKLVQEVSGLVHDATASHLAKEYAKQAKTLEDTAKNYTKAALAVSVIAILAAAFVFALVLVGDHSAGSVLSKAALTLPIIAFAAYLGGLASSHRRMAWRWRHVELQIQTAEPFIATLNETQRAALLSVLALRLFPGQTQDPTSGGESADSVNLSQLVSKLLAPQAGE